MHVGTWMCECIERYINIFVVPVYLLVFMCLCTCTLIYVQTCWCVSNVSHAHWHTCVNAVCMHTHWCEPVLWDVYTSWCVCTSHMLSLNAQSLCCLVLKQGLFTWIKKGSFIFLKSNMVLDAKLLSCSSSLTGVSHCHAHHLVVSRSPSHAEDK